MPWLWCGLGTQTSSLFSAGSGDPKSSAEMPLKWLEKWSKLAMRKKIEICNATPSCILFKCTYANSIFSAQKGSMTTYRKTMEYTKLPICTHLALWSLGHLGPSLLVFFCPSAVGRMLSMATLSILGGLITGISALAFTGISYGWVCVFGSWYQSR